MFLESSLPLSYFNGALCVHRVFLQPARMHASIVQDTKDGAILTVHIQPKASTTECVGIHGDAIKIRVAAPPVDGAANEELIRFLARRLSIPSTSVQIHSGAGGRHKRVLVKGATAQFVLACLNIGSQKGPAKA
jgi:uncharacterized protein